MSEHETDNIIYIQYANVPNTRTLPQTYTHPLADTDVCVILRQQALQFGNAKFTIKTKKFE